MLNLFILLFYLCWCNFWDDTISYFGGMSDIVVYFSLHAIKFVFHIQFYEFWQAHGVVYPQRHTHPPIPLCSSSHSLTPLPNPRLAVTDLFSIPIVLLSPECHTNGNLQYVASYIWLLSLSKVNLRFVRIVRSSREFIVLCWAAFLCMDVLLFV